MHTRRFRAPTDWRLRAAAAALLLAAAAPAIAQEATAAQEAPAPEEAAPSDAPGKFFFFTDTSVSLLPYGMGFEVDPDEQSTFTIEHAHASQIGDFFGFVDFNKFHGTARRRVRTTRPGTAN
jgi:nucleoside-specific outer membrane channel protein Tsx